MIEETKHQIEVTRKTATQVVNPVATVWDIKGDGGEIKFKTDLLFYVFSKDFPNYDLVNIGGKNYLVKNCEKIGGVDGDEIYGVTLEVTNILF